MHITHCSADTLPLVKYSDSASVCSSLGTSLGGVNCPIDQGPMALLVLCCLSLCLLCFCVLRAVSVLPLPPHVGLFSSVPLSPHSTKTPVHRPRPVSSLFIGCGGIVCPTIMSTYLSFVLSQPTSILNQPNVLNQAKCPQPSPTLSTKSLCIFVAVK